MDEGVLAVRPKMEKEGAMIGQRGRAASRGASIKKGEGRHERGAPVENGEVRGANGEVRRDHADRALVWTGGAMAEKL